MTYDHITLSPAKIQLGRQEWFALAKVGNTTCKDRGVKTGTR